MCAEKLARTKDESTNIFKKALMKTDLSYAILGKS